MSQGSPIQELLDRVDSSVLGVFWITQAALTPDLPLASEMDYLSNCQLSQYFKRTQGIASAQHNNIFIQKSFGQDFFICHLHQPPQEEDSALEQIQSLVSGLKSNKNKLIVISDTKSDYRLLIANKFPHLTVDQFSL